MEEGLSEYRLREMDLQNITSLQGNICFKIWLCFMLSGSVRMGSMRVTGMAQSQVSFTSTNFGRQARLVMVGFEAGETFPLRGDAALIESNSGKFLTDF